MNFNPSPSPGDPKPKGRTSEGSGARGGIAGRVEAASKMHAPAPKGKGLVMMILGVAVLGALIWDFTGRGAASRAVGRSAGNAERPVAPSRPDGEPGRPAPGAPDADGPLQIQLRIGNATLAMSAADAVARFGSAEGEDRATFRAQVLEALVKPAGLKGRAGTEAFETAARFVRDAEPASQKHLLQLKLRALVALTDDTRAPAAILFLKQLPESGGAEAMALLDEVILDDARPLRVRIEAARARGTEGRPPELEKLLKDPATHPSLVDALGG